MKTIHPFLFIIVLGIMLHACNFLDVLPVEELNKDEDAYKDADAIEKYLFSCYHFLPDIRREYVAISLLTGGEVISSVGLTSDKFVLGTYSPTNPIYYDWNNYFKGIVQCHLLLKNIDKAPDLEEDIKRLYKAEVTFLIGYYHALIYRLYGPVIIYDEDYVNQNFGVNLESKDFRERNSLDESLEYIISKIDEAIALGLKDGYFESHYFGRVNKQTALAVKALLLAQAASPLYNGAHDPNNPQADDLRSFYQDFTNSEGKPLMNLTYDPTKWEKAVDAFKAAIEAAEKAGYQIYENVPYSQKFPKDSYQRNLRFFAMDYENTQEIIWCDARQETGWSLQRLCIPYSTNEQGKGCVGPTLQYLYGFYTDKGVFIEDDPDFRYKKNESDKSEPKVGDVFLYGEQPNEENGKGVTALFNMHREPRFYAWIGYHNGYYEIYPTKAEKTNPDIHIGDGINVVRLQLRKNDYYGKSKEQNPTNYSPTGYLVKKWCMPYFERDKAYLDDYPFSNVRLADLYLMAAEALIEKGGDADIALAKTYIDKIRKRAGLKGVDESWAAVGKNVDKRLLRKIVRQEIQSEFFIENHRFYDLRRWLVAKQVYTRKPLGLNVDGITDEDFFKVVEVDRNMNFENKHYLMPIPQKDINISSKLKQNPGWK